MTSLGNYTFGKGFAYTAAIDENARLSGREAERLTSAVQRVIDDFLEQFA